MATSKSIAFLLVFSACFIFISCNNKNHEKLNSEKQGNTANLNDTLSINESLKKISLDFIETYNIDNSIIEVAINKKEFDEIYITLTCKGVAYFAVKKISPSLTYEIKNNTFFVFTGAEELLQPKFDEEKYKNRRQEKCDSVIRTCYLFQNNKMQKEDNCLLPEPFSNMPAESPLPTKK